MSPATTLIHPCTLRPTDTVLINDLPFTVTDRISWSGLWVLVPLRDPRTNTTHTAAFRRHVTLAR